MKKVKFDEITKKTAALIIDENGEIIIMENNRHCDFFSKIISEKLNIQVNEDQLEILMTIIVRQLNYISYMGCTSGDREYNGGIFHINDLKSLTDQQLITLTNLYSNLSLYYNIDIMQIKNGTDDKFISIGEIYEESLTRQDTTKKSL